MYALLACFFITSSVRRLKPEWSSIAGKLSFVATSFYLLGSESVLTLIVFIWVILMGWFILKTKSLGWKASAERTLVLVLGVLLLLPLFYFKYLSFVLNDLLGLDIETTSLLIPMGLSFYTFQTLSFGIDTLKRGEKLPKFLDYLNFTSFFPQIVAGPIERRKDLLPQVEKIEFRLQRKSIDSAISWIVLGLFYKMVLADNIGVIMSKSVVDPNNLYHVIAEITGYTLRIYFDFSGYSFVALGLGVLFGVNLTLNFRSPYWSINLQEFWKRWHITLSQWLRDYIYFPLGGSRSGIVVINLLITFLISGLWHGAGVNFIIWGALHGVGVIFCIYGPKIKVPNAIKWFITMLFVSYTWLFFFETDTQLLFEKATVFFNLDNYVLPEANSLQGFVSSRGGLINFALILFLSFVVIGLEGLSLKKKEAYCLVRTIPSNVVMAFLIVALTPVTQSAFIYFNF